MGVEIVTLKHVLLWWTVVGVLGELVAIPVVLGLRQEHAQTLHRLMEDPSVPEAQVEVVTLNHVQVLWR